jgi:hypothetical protein
MMHAYGRTLQQAGDLRLLALPVGAGRERYCVADGLEPLATFPTVERALAFFQAIREATQAAEAWPRGGAGGVTDLTAYRLRRPRRRRAATDGHGRAVPEEA